MLVAGLGSRLPASNAESLVKELLARIRGGAGGVTGFVNELRGQGLSDTVAAWLRQETSREPTVEQTERALGREFIAQAATLGGVSAETAARNLAFVLPKAVAGAAAEQDDAMYGNMPPRAVAWTIPIVLLTALAGLYWYVTADNPPPARRTTTAVEPPVVAVSKPPAKPKTPPPPLVSKPATPAPVEPPVVRVEPSAEKEAAAPAPAAAPPANGQRGNRYAVAALEALAPGAAGRDIAAAMNLSVTKFASNSAAIPKDSVEMLKRAAALLKAAPNGTRLEIGGHTDNIGDPAYNVYLSEKRAKAVREELVKQGVKGETLTARGYGGTRPVGANDTREGRERNRRIEFTVLP